MQAVSSSLDAPRGTRQSAAVSEWLGQRVLTAFTDDLGMTSSHDRAIDALPTAMSDIAAIFKVAGLYTTAVIVLKQRPRQYTSTPSALPART